MAQIVTGNKPISPEIISDEAKRLVRIMGGRRQRGYPKGSGKMLSKLDKLREETKKVLEEKGIVLTVGDFLRERER